MEIGKLTSAAVEALQHREFTGKAVTSVTVEPTRGDSGWISYEDTALVTYHDGETQNLNIRDTALSAALEQHAHDEAELGSVPTVVMSPRTTGSAARSIPACTSRPSHADGRTTSPQTGTIRRLVIPTASPTDCRRHAPIHHPGPGEET
ncbi:hypothetical protein AB0D34_08465 [Streptomyces sp. NPDC048420]|uniref:hypothetical protein n=1 Tax=Streptomyces sp. NPDC048420 TaxID=3155755 RepID=UPI00342BC51D